MRVRTGAVLVVALLAGGCASTASPANGTAASFTPQFPATAGGVTLKSRPSRIVSLSPSATEMLYSIDAAGQVAAVDDHSTYPDNAPRTTLSGVNPDVGAIAARKPDLVVLAEDTDQVREKLAKLSIPVYLAPAAKTLDDVYAQLRDLGTLTGQRPQADAVVAYVKGQLDELQAEVPARTRPLTYYYEIDPAFSSATSKTFIGSLFALAGLTNIADAADKTGDGYPRLSQEYILSANPDLVFLVDSGCCEQSADTVAARPGWAAITAVSRHHVVALDGDIAAGWGPRVVDLFTAIVDAVTAVPAT